MELVALLHAYTIAQWISSTPQNANLDSKLGGVWIGTNNCLAMDGSLERITRIMYSYDPHLASVRAPTPSTTDVA